jgi:PD-(D/E)XK endonuclease
MEHPKSKGDRTTLAVMMALRETGYAISIPFGENTRYDLLIDDGESIERVQCKTGRLRAGAVLFAVCSCYGHHRNPEQVRRDYQGEVDYFAVFCPETDAVYLVPIEQIPTRVMGTLRVETPRNNQRKHVRWASDFEIGRVGLERRPAGGGMSRPGARCAG